MTPDLLNRITFNPDIFGGKPIIRGRRLAVEHVLGQLAAGDSFEILLQGYPWLERGDILACLEYARATVGSETALPLPVCSRRCLKLLLDSCVWGGATEPLRARGRRIGF
jgi:uncharacterized protein (DUF433 family)